MKRFTNVILKKRNHTVVKTNVFKFVKRHVKFTFKKVFVRRHKHNFRFNFKRTMKLKYYGINLMQNIYPYSSS
jgi:hypothetical protein